MKWYVHIQHKQLTQLFLIGCFTCAPDSFELVYMVEWRNLITGEKIPLVVGGTRTQVLADSMAIAASS